MINENKAKRYCKEDISKIENYEQAVNDTTQVWDLHHRTAIWWNCSKKDLIENECYYHRKACELIFLTHAEHIRLHNMHMLAATRRKKSESLKGKNKGRIYSEEIRRKMSDSHITSVFGKAFKEQYGITRKDDIKLYRKEYSFYKRHSKFSWEV